MVCLLNPQAKKSSTVYPVRSLFTSSIHCTSGVRLLVRPYESRVGRGGSVDDEDIISGGPTVDMGSRETS